RVKHINIQHYFIREKLMEGRINLWYMLTLEQVTNRLIKALYRDKFIAFRIAMGVK
ncbi:hypothetical protein N431DRAFT_348921, partial [Stipitochalara longipes BDJ]